MSTRFRHKDGSWHDYPEVSIPTVLRNDPTTIESKLTTNLSDQIAFEVSDTLKKEQGIKFDGDKPDLSMLSFNALSQISQAFQFGAKKYGRYNYLGGMEWTRIAAAGLRHIYKWLWGEDRDDESGLHHLAHAGACIVMLLDYVTLKIGTDNRYKK